MSSALSHFNHNGLKKKLLLSFLIYYFPDKFMALFKINAFFWFSSIQSLTQCMRQQSFLHVAHTIMERASKTTAPKETPLTFYLGLPKWVRITTAVKTMPKSDFEQH